MWYNPVNWQRRTALVLFFIFAVTPILAVVGLMAVVFGCIYIPFMTVLYGWEGYKEGVDNMSDAIMDPVAELVYLASSIWVTHWDRLPTE